MTHVLPSVRLGASFAARRNKMDGCGPASFIEKALQLLPVEQLVPICLASLGALDKARSEFLEFRIENHNWQFPNLPPELDGFKILQLTDLHADLSSEFAPTLHAFLLSNKSALRADICVLTGDFQNHESDPHEATVDAVKLILSAIDCPVFASAGNHDRLSLVDALSDSGLRFLLNETAVIPFNSDSLHLCGIDDAHKYKTHSLESVHGHGFRVLLSHTPEVYEEASAFNFSLCLSGHTHAGQIQLFGSPLLKNAAVPNDFISGRWRHFSLQGYTSRGTGACTVPLRLDCPPEVTMHTLWRH